MKKENNYPNISNKLLECLIRDFPNELPNHYVNDFQLGVLIGQQQVIDKLKAEKLFNEDKLEL